MKNLKVRYILLLSICAIIILFLESCIPSLHGIVSQENRIVEDGIVGVWSDIILKDTSLHGISSEGDWNPRNEYLGWKFERALSIQGLQNASKVHFDHTVPSLIPSGVEIEIQQQLPYYILTHREIVEGDTMIDYMKVELTRIKSNILIDFTPFEHMNKSRLTRFSSNHLAAHTFAKLVLEGEKLVIFPLHGDFIYDLIQKKRIRLKHEVVGDNNDIVLTASSEELRAFISNYSDNPNLFDDPEILFRISD